MSVPAYLFYSALRGPAGLLLDEGEWTRYRFASPTARGYASPGPRSARRLAEVAREHLLDARILAAIAESMDLPEARRPPEAALAQATLVIALDEGTNGRIERLRALLRLFRLRPWGALAADRAVPILSVWALLDPCDAHRRWVRLKATDRG
ncbi:MAG: hypothetical protein L3K09_08160 [Thermoplasmata archaeon]|nr:hypothetical protein [Thermoplasmata archaeon]